MSRLTDLMKGSTQSPSSTPVLTPLAARLCDALESVAASDPRMSMVIRGFVKHLGRGTISDDEIRESLVWVRAMVDGVLDDAPVKEVSA